MGWGWRDWLIGVALVHTYLDCMDWLHSDGESKYLTTAREETIYLEVNK